MILNGIAIIIVGISVIIIVTYILPEKSESWYGVGLIGEQQSTIGMKYIGLILGGMGIPLGCIGIIGGILTDKEGEIIKH